MKSMYLALVSLIVAGFALFNSLYGKVDDANLIVSFLGVLVTLLVGLNIIQYIYAEKTVRRIVRAENGKLSRDFHSALNGVSMLISRCTFIDGTKLTSYFFLAMEALRKTSECTEPDIRNTSASYIIGFANYVVSKQGDDLPCKFFLGYRDVYIKTLRQFPTLDVDKITAFLEDERHATKELPDLPDTWAVAINAEDGVMRVKIM